MRRTLMAVVAGSLLGLVPVSTPPAHAVTTVVVVDGFDYPSSLSYSSQSCTTGASPATTALYRLGGARGRQATGVGFEGATGGMAGAFAKVANPRSLTAVTVSTYHPAAATATAVDGYFAAQFDPSGDDFQGSYYFAYEPLDATATTWGQWDNVAAVDLDWYFWNGTSSQDVTNGTIAQLANATGTDGSGAWVGFEFGCDGRDYYMDDLRITAGNTTVYDFEGARSRSYISAARTHHSHELVRDITRLTLIYGQDHYLLGDGRGLSDTVLPTGYIDGTGSLYGKRYGRSSYGRIGTKTYTAATYAHFHVEPARRTRYFFRTAPGQIYQGSDSKVLVVNVKRRIRARLADSTIRKGQRIVVSGLIRPRDRGVKVVLQRRTSTGWHNLTGTRTVSRGRYAVRVRARSTGRWVVRVKVPAARGNLGNVSPRLVVRVRPAPRPAPAPPPEPAPQPVVVTNPVPVTHVPTDDIKARVVLRPAAGSIGVPPAPAAGTSPGVPSSLPPPGLLPH